MFAGAGQFSDSAKEAIPVLSPEIKARGTRLDCAVTE
jgi:hypothetical protein